VFLGIVAKLGTSWQLCSITNCYSDYWSVQRRESKHIISIPVQ